MTAEMLKRATSPDTTDDNELVRRMQAGDTEAYGRLYERHNAELLRLLELRTRVVQAAEDIAQDTWILVAKHIGRFDTGRRFKPWLKTIARNESRRYESRNRRLRPLPEEWEKGYEQLAVAGPELYWKGRAVNARLAVALDSADRERTLPVLRHHVGGEEYREIAADMGKKPGALRTAAHRTVAALRQVLDAGPQYSVTRAGLAGY